LLSGRTVSPRLAPSAAVHRTVLNKVQLEPTRPAAQACVVHLHGEEKTAKAVAKDLYDHRCVNYVHLDTNIRTIKYEVPVTGATTKGATTTTTTTTYACTADPNRIFTPAGRQGVGKACVKKGTGAGQSDADIETAAEKEMEDFVNNDWGAGISKCRGGTGAADLAGPLPVLALHNNTGSDDTSKPIFEKKAYDKQFVRDDPKLGGDPNPSYTADPSHRSDILLVTKEADYAAIKPHFNVLFQNIQAGGDDGSLSVILEKERFINVEKRGLNNAALKSLGGGFTGHDAMYVKDYAMAAKALEVLGVSDGPCGATPATTPTIAPPVVKPPAAPPTTGAGAGSGSSAPVPDAGAGSGSSAPVPDAGAGSGGSTPTTGTPTTTPQPQASTGPYDYEPVTDKDKPSADCLIFDPSTIVTRRNEWAKKLSMLPVSDVLNWILGAWNFEAGTPKVVPDMVTEGVEESRRQRSCLLAAMVKGVTAQKGSVPVTKINELVDSGQRSFADQASIWNEKWKFTRKAPFDKISSQAASQSGGLLSAGGKWNTSSTTHKLMWGVLKASATSKDPEVEQFIKAGAVSLLPEEREKEILQASSAPGLSRHHAGTDFDIGDTTKKDQLDSSLWQPGAKFADFGRWLYHNAATWGFMRPFETKGGYGKGYMAEEWHWSYWPIAQALLDFARQNQVELEAALHKQWGGATAKTQFTFVWKAWRDFLNNVEETPRF
jgi:hypothetical protein